MKIRWFVISFLSAAFKWLLLLLIISVPATNRTFTEENLVSADKLERDDNLQAEADALLPLFDNMASVPVYVNDEPIIKSGANLERGVAYTNCKDVEFPFITVKKAFYQNTNRIQLVNILKHELTHSWLCRQHLMAGHDERFRRKFQQIGGFGN